MISKPAFLVLLLAALNCSAQGPQHPGCLDSLVLPNAFTPNGDGSLDVIHIDWPCQPKDFKITFYSRWGNEVYSSTDLNFKWDMKDDKGNVMAAGTYFFILEFTYLGEEKRFQQHIVIMS